MGLAACDNALNPTLVRATGCSISGDLKQVTAFVPASKAAALLQCVRQNGRVSMVFSKPTTYRTVQLKGRNAVVRGLAEGDLDVVEAYRRAFTREVGQVGFGAAHVEALLGCADDDIVGISFTPDEAYDQTPGPKAGEPLNAAP